MIRRETRVRVRYRDTDQMGVVYHGVYLEYFETGRTELLRELGMAYSSIEQGGVMLPVLEAYSKIHRPARYDDLLTIITQLETPTAARMKIDYEVLNGDQILVSGYTVHVFTTADGMRPVRPPREFLRVLEENNSQ